MLEKQQLSAAQIEEQAGFDLPDREMMALVNIQVFDVLNNNEVIVQVPIGVAANVCGIDANILAQQTGDDAPVDCDATVQQLPRAFQ